VVERQQRLAALLDLKVLIQFFLVLRQLVAELAETLLAALEGQVEVPATAVVQEAQLRLGKAMQAGPG
jgi:hypothetical protein